MPKVDPRDFLLNTDYEMDKIVVVDQGILNPGETKNVPHGLSFTPLMFGCCAYKEDFSDSRSLPYADDFLVVTSSGGGSIIPRVAADVSADGNTIEIGYTNESSNPQPIYYRVFGFEPPDSHATTPATRKYAKIFTLNTDNNYRKIYKTGFVNFGERLVINHNMGYIPQVSAWFSYGDLEPGRIVQQNGENLSSANRSVTVNKNTVIIDVRNYSPLLNNAVLYYRIYYDEV